MREDLLREQQRSSRQLDEEARAAHKTKELITKHLERQRCIKEKEMELAKACLIASLLRESDTKNATAVALDLKWTWPRAGTDWYTVFTEGRGCSPHNTLVTVSDNLQPSTPYIHQSNPVTTQHLISHSVPEHITCLSTSKPLHTEPVTVVPSPIYPVVLPSVSPQ